VQLRGRALWRASPGAAPTWVEGAWEVAGGRLHRVPLGDEGVPACWIVPGLADVHCHIGIRTDGPADSVEQERQAVADRDSGVLVARDCGVPVDNAWIQDRADLPVLVRCGRHVARPKRYLRGMALELDDPAALPGEVVRQARAGDGWVKVVGDWIDRSAGADADLAPLWPREILVDAVAAAHEAGARVAVHAFSHRVVDDLLEAGVDDIEHGTGMDDDQMAEAAAHGVSVTPTLLQTELFESFAQTAGARYPRYGATMRAMSRERHEHAARLFDSGVQMLAGTDAGGNQQHGSLPLELALWRDLGVDPARILDIATWQSRDVLGVDSLQEGARADLLVLDADPARDLEALTHPRATVLEGRVIAGG